MSIIQAKPAENAAKLSRLINQFGHVHASLLYRVGLRSIRCIMQETCTRKS